jgi:mono/diheme cytochrome c family protein
MKRLSALPVFLFAIGSMGSRAADAPAINFQRQIRPLLSDNCFQCHGPDPQTRMADLRLDLREGAFGTRPNGTPIVPGDTAKSLVVQRITQPDAALRMPPLASHKELTQDQIALIRTWIEQGAPWSEHWAFTELKRPEPPAVKNKSWVRNPTRSRGRPPHADSPRGSRSDWPAAFARRCRNLRG